MSSSRATSWRPPCLASLVILGLACSDGVTEPEASVGPALTPPAVTVTDGLDSDLHAAGGRAMFIRVGVLFANEVVPPPAPCLQMFNTVIEGHATHLGRVEGTGSTCITDAVAPDLDPPFPAPGPGPYLTATFTNPRWELTAADGDELWLEGDPSVCVISLADNSLRCEGSHRVIGGTGRFEGATGELVSRAVNEDGAGPDDFTSRGWIRY